jgi:hypothetical protein
MKQLIGLCATVSITGSLAAWSQPATAAGLPALERRVAALEAALAEPSILEQRVADLEAARAEPPTAIQVACPGDSLAAAVGLAVPGTPLTITVTGRCAQPVVTIDRDDVTIQGATRADGVDGRVRIVGAHRVTLRNLTVENTDGAAVDIRESASAILEDVTAIGDLVSAPNSGRDGYGVAVSRHAYARLVRVDALVRSGGNNALYVADGATVRSVDGSFVSQSDTPFDNTAIGLFRGASLRMNGQPLIENRNTLPPSEPTRHLAVQVAHTSNFRINDEVAEIHGSIHVFNNSAARVRRLGGNVVGPGNLVGSVLIQRDSNLELGTRSTLTVTGRVLVLDQSLLIPVGPPASVGAHEGVFCTGPSGGIINVVSLAPLPHPSGCSLL